MKIKMKEIKKKYYLETFIILWIKWRGTVGIKTFIDVVLIISCQNSPWVLDWRIYGEGRIQIPLSSPATINLLVQDLELAGSILI